MHTIDLLKGQGIPQKTTLGGVFFSALIFILPIVAGSIMAGMYAINKINIDMQMITLEKLENSVEEYLPGKQEAAKLREEKSYYAARINEASKCIDTYFQWSPVLITLVENMPEDMVIDNLSVSSISTAPPKKATDPNLPLVIPVPKKKVTIDLRGIGKDAYNVQVQEYQEKLKSEESLLSMLDDITYIKQTVRPDKPEESFTMNFILDKKKK